MIRKTQTTLLALLHSLLVVAPFLAPVLAVEARAEPALRVLAVERAPFVMKGEDGRLTGFAVDLWSEILSRMEREGRIETKDSFSDMLGEVAKGEADLAIGNISITSQREATLDFSQPFLDSGLQILLRDDAMRGSNFLSAVWDSPAPAIAGYGLLALLLVALAMWALERGKNPSIRMGLLGGVWDSFWWAFMALTTGGADRPASAFSRIFAMVWVLVGLLAISSLTASITTFLTVQQLSTGVQSYQDLKGMKVGLATGTTMARFARQRGVAFRVYPDSSDVLTALEAGEIEATFLDAPVAQHYALNRGAGVASLAGPVFARDKLGMAFPNGSALQEPVNRALLQVFESGVYDRLHKRYFGE